MPDVASVLVKVHLTSMPMRCDGPLVVGLGVPDPDGQGVRFEGTVRVKPDADGRPDFSGPLVHGPRGERFLYVTWGVAKGGKPVMFRRLKLYLSPLSRAAWNQPGLAWQDLAAGAVVVEVDGRGAMGSPACGTAPARWRPQD